MRETERRVRMVVKSIETNHSFIKGWGYLILMHATRGNRSNNTRRDVDKTAYSLLRVHDVPGASGVD